LRYQKYI